jgi:hypothetical protein
VAHDPRVRPVCQGFDELGEVDLAVERDDVLGPPGD